MVRLARSPARPLAPSSPWTNHSPVRFYRIDEIISGRSEAEKVLFRSPPSADPFGFLILPDMKWDLTNVASLYLVALMLRPDIKSLRDLNRSHIPLLRSIRREATNIVKSRWGLQATELRLYVHYQPSYCKCCGLPLHTRIQSSRMSPADHFHVHIVNANHLGLMGMTVGQAHMLDDIISLVRAFWLRRFVLRSHPVALIARARRADGTLYFPAYNHLIWSWGATRIVFKHECRSIRTAGKRR